MAESAFNPQELREAAERTRRESMALSNAILPVDSGVGMLDRVKRHEMLADYVLANVQENDLNSDATCDKMVALLEHYRRHCQAGKWCRCKEINAVIAEYHAARKARTKNSKVHRNGPPVH